jgi:hypothetical protein
MQVLRQNRDRNSAFASNATHSDSKSQIGVGHGNSFGIWTLLSGGESASRRTRPSASATCAGTWRAFRRLAAASSGRAAPHAPLPGAPLRRSAPRRGGDRRHHATPPRLILRSAWSEVRGTSCACRTQSPRRAPPRARASKTCWARRVCARSQAPSARRCLRRRRRRNRTPNRTRRSSARTLLSECCSPLRLATRPQRHGAKRIGPLSCGTAACNAVFGPRVWRPRHIHGGRGGQRAPGGGGGGSKSPRGHHGASARRALAEVHGTGHQ